MKDVVRKINVPFAGRSFQFSLSTLLMLPVFIAIAMPGLPLLWRAAVELYRKNPIVLLVAVAVALVCYVVGLVVSILAVSLTRTTRRKAILCVILLASLAVACYAGWARERWVYVARHVYDARGFPYPDYVVWGYHEWLDARRPPPPGGIKLNAEVYSVLTVIEEVLIIFVGFAAGIVGILTPCLVGGLHSVANWMRRSTRIETASPGDTRVNRD